MPTKIFKFLLVLFGALFCLGLRQTALAQSQNVVINEVAWSGTTENWRQEWIELYNTTGQVINLTGWQIENAYSKNQAVIIESGQIAPNGYFLICRAAIANCDIVATKISLHNEYQTNGALALKNASGQIVDQTPLAEQLTWPGGDNTTKQTMERIEPLASGLGLTNWQTSQEAGGTPKTANSQGITNSQLVKPSPLPTSTSETADVSESPEGSSLGTPERTPLEPLEVSLGATNTQPVKLTNPVYPKNIFINEILPAPEGADNKNEWVEIFNANDFTVNLTSWQIKDTVGVTKTYTLPDNSQIAANGFLLISRPESKITLQNNGDGLTLFNPQGTIADQIVYPPSPANQSYNRTNSGWAWSRLLTPGNANEIDKVSAAVQQKISQKNQQTTASATSAASSNLSTAAAQINQFSPQTNKSPRIFTLLLGLAIAAVSTAVVFFLRKKPKEDPKIF